MIPLPTPNLCTYIGSRAIFDPNFIPPISIPQHHHEEFISGLLSDAIADHFATNAILFGLRGMGKNLLINRLLRAYITNHQTKPLSADSIPRTSCTVSSELLQSLSLRIQPTLLHPKIGKKDCDSSAPNADSLILRVDCTQKDITHILLHLISQLGNLMNETVPLNYVREYDIANLWDMFKNLVDKVGIPLILYLQKLEDVLHVPFLSKLFTYAKSMGNLQIITCLDSGTQNLVCRQISNLDHRIMLDSFQSADLMQITRDRSIMAFKQSLPEELVQIIVDYVIDFERKSPGCCVNYLKDLYPLIQNHHQVTPEQIRNLSQYHFENFAFDELSVAEFVINTNLEDRLFLDYIVNYFQKSDRYYIPFKDIEKAYYMTSEELGFTPSKQEFQASLTKISRANILRPSLTSLDFHNEKRSQRIPHYLTIPVEDMNDIMRVSFGDIEDVVKSPENSNNAKKDSDLEGSSVEFYRPDNSET
jgi:hypothetical protein